MFFDEPKYYVIASIVAILCLFFVVLYMRYQNMKTQRKLEEEQKLIKEGEERLQNEYFTPDGSLNPTPFVFEDVMDDELIPDEKSGGEKQVKKPGMMKKVVDSLKNGKLLKTINNFAVKTNKLTERITSREKITEEERVEREQYGRLADDAVNPLFARKFAKFKKEQEEKEKKKAEEQQRFAAAQEMMGGGNADKEKDNSKEGAEKDEKKKSGIYQFNAAELAQLEKVMSATPSIPPLASSTKEKQKDREEKKEEGEKVGKEKKGDEEKPLSITDCKSGERSEYLGAGGVDGAVEGAFQTENTRNKQS